MGSAAAFGLFAAVAYFAHGAGTPKYATSIKSHWIRLRTSLLVRQGILRRRESIRLTPQHSIHLIEFGARQLLLACHPGGATLISPHPAGITEGRVETNENATIAD